MQHSPLVKVTIVKKRRSSRSQSVKSVISNVSVTRVKSSKEAEKTLVVENVDTIPAVRNNPSSSKKAARPLTTSSVVHISRSRSLKSAGDNASEQLSHDITHSSKPYTILPVQGGINNHSSVLPTSLPKHIDSFNSNTRTQFFDSSSIPLSTAKDTRINSSLSQLDVGDRREIYTIGKENMNNNKKRQKCSLRYYIAFGVFLFLIFGIILALPVIVIVSMATTTTLISMTSTTATISTATTTSATAASTISATTTTAAATVTITSNTCTSTWKGITMIYHCDNCVQQSVYASLSFNYIAIENQTRIAFVLRRASGYFGIDDVSIRDAAAPTIELLSNGGFETGSFSSWTHCVQSGSPATGSVQSTSSGISYGAYNFTAHSGLYYYLGGATVNAEYLSQLFPSVIGNTYIFSFSYVYVGSGASSSGDFLLSV